MWPILPFSKTPNMRINFLVLSTAVCCYKVVKTKFFFSNLLQKFHCKSTPELLVASTKNMFRVQRLTMKLNNIIIKTKTKIEHYRALSMQKKVWKEDVRKWVIVVWEKSCSGDLNRFEFLSKSKILFLATAHRWQMYRSLYGNDVLLFLQQEITLYFHIILNLQLVFIQDYHQLFSHTSARYQC